MRYFKFSILTGIGLFALAMFFLSQSIQGFLGSESSSDKPSEEPMALDISLSDPADFPELDLDFPAGPNQSQLEKTLTKTPTTAQRTSLNPALPSDTSEESPENTPEETAPPVKLVTMSNQQSNSSQALNILLLSQTTKQQRTSLIEELLRVDAELVRQIALKPNFQESGHPVKEVKTVQQISQTSPAPQQTISAGYAVTRQPAPKQPDQYQQYQAPLVQQEKPVHVVASYRGYTIKTLGIPTQSGILHQIIHVASMNRNSKFYATVLSNNLVKLKVDSELPLPADMQTRLEMKLSQLGEFQPVEVIKLSGTGLVIGLNGTGERTFSEEAIKALSSSITSMNIDLKQIKTPIQSGNLANVSIIAYIPNAGVTKGQNIKCYITASHQGVNLSGGYLLPTALSRADYGNSNADAMAMGTVLTHQNQTKSRGTITHGAQMLSHLRPQLVSTQGIPHLNFFLNSTNNQSQPHMSQFITQKINQYLQSLQSIRCKAIPNSSNVIMISLPHANQQQAHNLASQILELPIPIDPSFNQNPELILDFANAKIQTKGKVLVQSAHLQHSDLTLEVSPLVPAESTELNDLLALMHYLQIPKIKQMQLLRGLQQQGKIRAAYQQL